MGKEVIVPLIAITFIIVIFVLMVISVNRGQRATQEVSELRRQAAEYLDALAPEEKIEHYRQAVEWQKRQSQPLNFSGRSLELVYAQYLIYRNKIKSAQLH